MPLNLFAACRDDDHGLIAKRVRATREYKTRCLRFSNSKKKRFWPG